MANFAINKGGCTGLTIQELFIVNLKGYRKLHHISQMQLAEMCNSSTGYIGEIEAGKRFPSVGMIERIAEALGVESWRLFRNEPVDALICSPPQLVPTQKEQILKMANTALSKILDGF